MKFNASKTKTMIVSRSRTMFPQSPPLTIEGTVLKESDDLSDSLGVTFDSKMTFEKHLRSVSGAASKRLGILKSFVECFMIDRFFGDLSGFVLPVLEYCFGVLFWSTRLPIHPLNYWIVQSVVPGFQLGVCLSVALLIVGLWQYCVCCIRSGV